MGHNTRSLADYRDAKKKVKDLTVTIDTVKKTIKVLNDYHEYMPVREMINSLSDNSILLQLKLDYYQKILDGKAE